MDVNPSPPEKDRIAAEPQENIVHLQARWLWEMLGNGYRPLGQLPYSAV